MASFLNVTSTLHVRPINVDAGVILEEGDPGGSPFSHILFDFTHLCF